MCTDLIVVNSVISIIILTHTHTESMNSLWNQTRAQIYKRSYLKNTIQIIINHLNIFVLKTKQLRLGSLNILVKSQMFLKNHLQDRRHSSLCECESYEDIDHILFSCPVFTEVEVFWQIIYTVKVMLNHNSVPKYFGFII